MHWPHQSSVAGTVVVARPTLRGQQRVFMRTHPCSLRLHLTLPCPFPLTTPDPAYEHSAAPTQKVKKWGSLCLKLLCFMQVESTHAAGTLQDVVVILGTPPSDGCLLEKSPEQSLSNEMIDSSTIPLPQSSENKTHKETGENKYRLKSCNYYLMFLKRESTSVWLHLIILPRFHLVDIPFALKGQSEIFNQHLAMMCFTTTYRSKGS